MRRIIVLILVLLLCMTSATAASFDPHKATAYMDIKFECGCWGAGTGAMVGRHGLITCAHNLCCPTHGKWYKSITFVFGAKSANSGQKKVSSGFSAWVYDTFQNGYNSEDDIGYVVFNKPIGDSTGWFATHAASDTDVEFTFTNVYYYDLEGHYNTVQQLLNVVSDNQLVLDKNPVEGDGAPITIREQGNDYPVVVGVYTNPTGYGEGFARRLTNKVFNDMEGDGVFR